MRNDFKIINPVTTGQLKKYFNLRWEILRKPFGQKPGTEVDEFENLSFHQMVIDENEKPIGVGRIHFLKDFKNRAQIRYMGILSSYTNLGLGSKILFNLEKYAFQNKINKIFLNARENATSFYIKNGYKKIKKTHILYNQIQHWLMEKEIG